MLRRQLQKRRPGQGVDQFILQKRFVLRKLPAQTGSDPTFQFILRIRHNAHPPENYYAADIQRPIAFPPETFVHDAIADFIVLLNGVQLVAGFRAMKV